MLTNTADAEDNETNKSLQYNNTHASSVVQVI